VASSGACAGRGVEHAERRGRLVDVGQRARNTPRGRPRARERSLRDEVAIGQRRRQRVPRAVEDRAHLGEHQLQRDVVVDQVVAQQRQQPLVAQRVVDRVRGSSGARVRSSRTRAGSVRASSVPIASRRGLELDERQRGVPLHELHRLREALPVEGGAQDVVAVDDRPAAPRGRRPAAPASNARTERSR
jgi:hypothetical protein